MGAAMSNQADDKFTHYYGAYFKSITWYIRVRLDERHYDYAEDLAQETFIRFWRWYVQPGKLRNENGIYSLLSLQARSVMAAFYEARATSERVTDFADPLNTPLTVGSGVYAPGMPTVAPLVRELEDAMERMTEASKAWRDQHKATYSIRVRIGKSVKADVIAGLEAKYQDASERGEHLLSAFRDTCLRVGQLRADIEQAAGPRYNASSGGPEVPAQREKTAGALTSDPTVKHCPSGHRLFLENTNFSEDGARRCRTCKAQQASDWWGERRAAARVDR